LKPKQLERQKGASNHVKAIGTQEALQTYAATGGDTKQQQVMTASLSYTCVKKRQKDY